MDLALRYKDFPRCLQRKDQVLVTLSGLRLWWPPVFFTWASLLGLSCLCSRPIYDSLPSVPVLFFPCPRVPPLFQTLDGFSCLMFPCKKNWKGGSAFQIFPNGSSALHSLSSNLYSDFTSFSSEYISSDFAIPFPT